MKPEREAFFPRLASSDYGVTSDETSSHNCIAYAAGDLTRKWDCLPNPTPGYFWPEKASRGYELEHLISVFAELGYEVCEGAELESGFEKVALYADGDGEWQHAAKQREDGKWSSKLGDWEDICHAALDSLGSSDYGEPVCYMKRPIQKSCEICRESTNQ